MPEQLEESKDNYTAIPNKIMKALWKADITPMEWKVFMFMASMTFGYENRKANLKNQFISDNTGIAKRHICRTVKKLIEKQMLFKEGETYWINKRVNEWLIDPQTGTRSVPIQGQVVPKQGQDTSPQTGTKSIPKQGQDTSYIKKTINKTNTTTNVVVEKPESFSEKVLEKVEEKNAEVPEKKEEVAEGSFFTDKEYEQKFKELSDYLKKKLGIPMIAGNHMANVINCHDLINEMVVSYPDADPVMVIKKVIDKAMLDDFDRMNSTKFSYIRNNAMKIIVKHDLKFSKPAPPNPVEEEQKPRVTLCCHAPYKPLPKGASFLSREFYICSKCSKYSFPPGMEESIEKVERLGIAPKQGQQEEKVSMDNEKFDEKSECCNAPFLNLNGTLEESWTCSKCGFTEFTKKRKVMKERSVKMASMEAELAALGKTIKREGNEWEIVAINPNASVSS